MIKTDLVASGFLAVAEHARRGRRTIPIFFTRRERAREGVTFFSDIRFKYYNDSTMMFGFDNQGDVGVVLRMYDYIAPWSRCTRTQAHVSCALSETAPRLYS